jgi:hypothetical protein
MSTPMRDAARHRTPARYAARISVRDGVVLLPAASPYEWQLLCEHVVAAARQRGSVCLRVGRVECVVHCDGAAGRRCSGCARLPRVTFRVAWRELCPDCAGDWLARDPAADEARGATGLG